MLCVPGFLFGTFHCCVSVSKPFYSSLWKYSLSLIQNKLVIYRSLLTRVVGRRRGCHHINTGCSFFFSFFSFNSKRWRTSRRSTWSAAKNLTAWPLNPLSTPNRKSLQAHHDTSRVRTKNTSNGHTGRIYIINVLSLLGTHWRCDLKLKL